MLALMFEFPSNIAIINDVSFHKLEQMSRLFDDTYLELNIR